MMPEVPKPSKTLTVLFCVLGIFLVGGPLVLAWSFFRLLVSILTDHREMINSSFFFLGVLLPLLTLLVFVGAEIVIGIRLVRWQKRLTKIARADAMRLRQIMTDSDR
jgi:hypothetical protein